MDLFSCNAQMTPMPSFVSKVWIRRIKHQNVSKLATLNANNPTEPPVVGGSNTNDPILNKISGKLTEHNILAKLVVKNQGFENFNEFLSFF